MIYEKWVLENEQQENLTEWFQGVLMMKSWSNTEKKSNWKNRFNNKKKNLDDIQRKQWMRRNML